MPPLPHQTCRGAACCALVMDIPPWRHHIASPCKPPIAGPAPANRPSRHPTKHDKIPQNPTKPDKSGHIPDTYVGSAQPPPRVKNTHYRTKPDKTRHIYAWELKITIT